MGLLQPCSQAFPGLVPRLSPQRRGEPGTFYHMHDIKGRHDLITRGWTKLGAHALSRTSVFKTTTVFFWMLPSSLQSAI